MSRTVLNGMVVDSFDVDKSPSNGVVVFLNGFPGAIGPLPAVLSGLGNGYTVIAPQYPGTYDSSGEHTLIGTATALVELFDWIADQKMDSSTDGIRVIAHSFGAFHLLNAMRKKHQKHISKILLLAPILNYATEPDAGIREELLPHLKDVIESRPHTYRVGAMNEWEMAARGEPLFDLAANWSGKVFIGFGTEDDTFDPEVFERNSAATIERLIGCRNTVVQSVAGAGHGMHEIIPYLAILDEFYA
ncbi:alpha/beta fold hydrolase [Nitratireductor sp. CAU 1489]|uniref:Alpha/beta fold hydrolase n=1 Tax=Nitratireductor arenosus TaxID=2682096 RepID=A0A844QBW9_9HYPH|nr:alpha/beta hydrolase [Nitratireductor arenosus]MVA95653.1 alpha/beta fold hydrolase [Nitratireductor arenosus]